MTLKEPDLERESMEELNKSTVRFNSTLNVSNDGQVEILKPKPKLSKTMPVSKTLASTDREQLEVVMSTKPALGKRKRSTVRASLVEKKDVGC